MKLRIFWYLLVATIMLSSPKAFAEAAKGMKIGDIKKIGEYLKIEVESKEVIDETKLKATIGDKDARIVERIKIPNGWSLEAEIPSTIKPEKFTIAITYGDKPIEPGPSTILFQLPELGGQPQITKIQPWGGRKNDTITIYGNYFGDDREKIKIQIIDKVEIEEMKDNQKIKSTKEIRKQTGPTFLAKVPNEKEYTANMQFTIPQDWELPVNTLLRHGVRFEIIVNGQPSNVMPFTLLRENWKGKVLLLTVFVVLLLLTLMVLVTKRLNCLTAAILDQRTNSYSLSKFQAFAWTTILVGSYFYFAISSGLIYGLGKIPDFNSSLLCLMGISFGGTLVAQQLNRFHPKKEFASTPPRFINLISEGDEISIPRLQLLGFTITAMIIYIYNLASAELISKGLPDIPPTLLGLMGISQGGYLGGKLVSGRMFVNCVLPGRILINKEIDLNIIGTGFDDKTKALVEDQPGLLEPERKTETCLVLKNLKFSQEGFKDMLLVPPSGSSLPLRDIFEVVDAKIEKIERVKDDRKRVNLTLKGFYLDAIQATLAGKPPKGISVNKDLNLITLEAVEDIKSGDVITISSLDGELKAEIQVS